MERGKRQEGKRARQYGRRLTTDLNRINPSTRENDGRTSKCTDHKRRTNENSRNYSFQGTYSLLRDLVGPMKRPFSLKPTFVKLNGQWNQSWQKISSYFSTHLLKKQIIFSKLPRESLAVAQNYRWFLPPFLYHPTHHRCRKRVDSFLLFHSNNEQQSHDITLLFHRQRILLSLSLRSSTLYTAVVFFLTEQNLTIELKEWDLHYQTALSIFIIGCRLTS